MPSAGILGIENGIRRADRRRRVAWSGSFRMRHFSQDRRGPRPGGSDSKEAEIADTKPTYRIRRCPAQFDALPARRLYSLFHPRIKFKFTGTHAPRDTEGVRAAADRGALGKGLVRAEAVLR